MYIKEAISLDEKVYLYLNRCKEYTSLSGIYPINWIFESVSFGFTIVNICV